ADAATQLRLRGLQRLRVVELDRRPREADERAIVVGTAFQLRAERVERLARTSLREQLVALVELRQDGRRQRLQERDEVLRFVRRERQRSDERRKMRVRTAALHVEIDDLVESRERAVVHVRRGESDVAQRRRAEGAAV